VFAKPLPVNNKGIYTKTQSKVISQAYFNYFQNKKIALKQPGLAYTYKITYRPLPSNGSNVFTVGA
jgi:hypothetical protein